MGSGSTIVYAVDRLGEWHHYNPDSRFFSFSFFEALTRLKQSRAHCFTRATLVKRLKLVKIVDVKRARGGRCDVKMERASNTRFFSA